MNYDYLNEYVERNIDSFHQKRLENLEKFKLEKLLSRKNIYMMKAKNINTAHDFVKALLDAHLSSQEETMFGDFLEGLAIFINNKIYGGKKSSTQGIDLEFEKNGIIYLISIKSGPNWGNSSQINKMRSDFNTAKKVLRQNNREINISAINGCCYGRDSNPDKGDYFKYCGQLFWELISGDSQMFIRIIEPIGYKAKEKNDNFYKSYSAVVNKFTKNFLINFSDNSGNIDWEKLLIFNSSKEKNGKLN